MLTFDNQYWKFKNSQELDEFLNSAIDSGDDYHISSHGLSNRGEWYAFGYRIVKTKFGKASAQKQAEQQQQDVTTF